MRVVVLGAGGHAAVVIDILQLLGLQVIAALDADRDRWGTSVLGVPVVGDDDQLPRLKREGATHAIVAMGDNRVREVLSRAVLTAGLQLGSAVHPSASVSKHAQLAPGTVVMGSAVVNARTKVGTASIVNTSSSIDHDCDIGDFVHVAPGAHVGGGVRIGSGSLVGIGATVLPNIVLGDRTIVGGGAVVTASAAGDTTLVGIPARPQARR